MASKIFLDANVLLDLTLKRENYNDAKEIIELVINNKVEAFITPSIVHIIGHYLTKYYNADKAREIILALLANVKTIDIPHEVVLIALHSQIKDIEDSLQYYAARHHKINYFISMDKALQKKATITLPVLKPGEFLFMINP
jgi:predicted nucleic acid-binding protein